jgi:hypothetical protein
MKFAKCVPDNYPLLEKVEQNFDNFAFINPLFTGVPKGPRKPPHEIWTNLFKRLGGGKGGPSSRSRGRGLCPRSEQKSIRGGLRGFTPVFLKVIIFVFIKINF